MEFTPSKSVVTQDVNHVPAMQDVNLTAKDGLFIATECHLALFPDEDGDTALHLAVVQGNYEACRKLVDLFRMAGKSIDVHNNLLQTPLHVAIITNHKEIAKLLVRHGSDPNNPDRFGSTAFHLCAKYDNPECLHEIFQNMGDRKRNLNVRDYEGLTSLHVSVLHGSISTFKLLVANGADIDAKDNKGGRTPLIYAIEMNERAIVELLLECDASVSQQTYSGDTALHIASGRGLQEIVRLLLRRGADATMKNTHSETPISLATSPSVSDILRTQYGSTSSPETKTLTMADTQYAQYIARNVAVPMPPHFLKIFNASMEDKGSPPSFVRDQTTLQKKARKFKLEHGDEATPPKRPFVNMLGSPTGSTPLLAPISPVTSTDRSPLKVSESSILPPNFVVKREFQYIPTQRSTQDEDSENSGGSSRGSDNKDDEASKRMSDISDEHVEIAMEEVEVSTEEEIQTKSDDDESPTGSHPLNFQDEIRGTAMLPGASEQPYTHKLMQYSTNTSKTSFKDGETIENKPVIVQRQPQLDIATALSREYARNLDTKFMQKSFTPSASPRPSATSQALMKSKSVPNSPQPAEANLYQLAREGLAVAAMAAAHPHHVIGRRDFGLSLYLKARPSRQAKIKAGTEELQNLALQGLAVAAMNAQSELFQKSTGRKKPKSAEEGDIPSSLTSLPNHLNQVINPVKEGLPPALYRSNSMPPKQYFERETTEHQFQALNQLASNNALLALAHANAMKEHVGQAVSAKSMARASQSNASGLKFHSVATTLPVSANEISENTRLNLRQAIMVKNPAVVTTLDHKLQPLEVYNPKSKKHQALDPNNPIVKISDPKMAISGNHSTLSIKILPPNTIKTATPPIRFVKPDDPMSGQMPAVAAPHSTFTMPVAVTTRPKSPAFSVVQVSIPKKIPPLARAPQSLEKVPRSVTSFPPVVVQAKASILPHGIKPSKDSAPTHTVAPLQMPMNKGIARKADDSKQQTLISVAMAPVVTSRVASPSSQIPSKSEMDAAAATSTPQQPQLATNALLPTANSMANGAPSYPHVALGGLQPQVLNPALANLGLHAGTPYVQPQIAYIQHGKDLIPVIVPQHTFPPQVQYPPYAATPLQVQSSNTSSNVSTPAASSVVVNTSIQVNPAYLNSVSKLPTLDPSLLYRMPMPLQDAQMRSLYPMTTPIYGTQVQQSLDLQQQLLKNALLYQQSLLSQSKPGVPQLLSTVTATTSRPVAAVSAVPAQKPTPMSTASIAKVVPQCADEQPLNLSKKPTVLDQPLNLMKANAKTTTQMESSLRTSVIKSVPLAQTESPRSTGVDASNVAGRATNPQIVTPSHPGIYLPPPVIINPAAVPHATQSAALSALSLPPIHYVNGMPFILGMPPMGPT